MQHFRSLSTTDLIADRTSSRVGGARSITAQSGMAITSDDKYLFVAQKVTNWISIIDLNKARTGQTASSIVGGIPLSGKPLATELSPDRRFLYVSTRVDVPSTDCKTIPDTGPVEIQVFDVNRAFSDPNSSMIVTVPAGCAADRGPTDGISFIAVSPDGNSLYTVAYAGDRVDSVGEANTLFTFDTRPLRSGSAPTLIAGLPIRTNLRRLVLVDEGRKLLATSWNQLGDDSEGQVLTVIDTDKLARGENAIAGTISIGTGDGSLSVTHDGRAVLIAARTSATVTRLEWSRVPLFAQQVKSAAANCNQPMPDPITQVKIDGNVRRSLHT